MVHKLNLQDLQQLCYKRSYKAGWYHDENGERKIINDGERLMLIVSEISEAMEGVRKDLPDDKLPHRKMLEVELADAIIRICDYAEHKGLDLMGAVEEKLQYNLHRPDHKKENRFGVNGKKF